MASRADNRPVRERLLDAADTLFYGQGLGRTGVDAVLAEAQVSTATLYAQFGGKDALIAAYLSRRLERWQHLWEQRIAAAATPEDRLLAIFDALEQNRTDEHPGRGCAFLATATEMPQAALAVHDIVAAETEQLDTTLRALAAQTDAPDPEALAVQVRLAYDGALSAFLRPGTTDPIAPARQLARTAIRAATAWRPTS
ncbi:MAG: TetR/AcrR family transcriptional regulator [Gaiellales bacterium]